MSAEPKTLFALTIAGGRGERLKPLTDAIPKPMVPIEGEPLLLHQARLLMRGGVTDIARPIPTLTAWSPPMRTASSASSPKRLICRFGSTAACMLCNAQLNRFCRAKATTKIQPFLTWRDKANWSL